MRRLAHNHGEEASPVPLTEFVPRILLVDCDAFFVQVARLEDPEGAGQTDLLIVGGSPTGRGVVTSASYQARRLGVRSAMPTAEALRYCPDAVVVGVNRVAVGVWSRRVHETLRQLAPVVQPASVDEFYLDMTGTERLFKGESLRETAERIRETVKMDTGVDVSVGGGTRPLIAKLATRYAKPAGVHVVEAGHEEAFMQTLELAEIPGVGPSLARALEAKGLVKISDAWPIELEWWCRWYGTRKGNWLYHRIRGMDRSNIDPRDARLSISSERTFRRDENDDAGLERRLLRLSGSVAATLRSKSLRARTISVKLRDHDFRTRQRSRTLPRAVESDAAVFRVAEELFSELRRRRRVPARLLGVGLGGLVRIWSPPKDGTDLAGPVTWKDGELPSDELPLGRLSSLSEGDFLQMDLFGASEDPGPETTRDRLVSRAVDEVRLRFGDKLITRGSLVGKRPEDPA